MISRLTASAAVFAILVTTGLAFASDNQPARAATAPTAAATDAVSITFPRVEVTGHRTGAR